MPVMARMQTVLCHSSPCQTVTAKIAMPWIPHGQHLAANVLENRADAGLPGVRSS